MVKGWKIKAKQQKETITKITNRISALKRIIFWHMKISKSHHNILQLFSLKVIKNVIKHKMFSPILCSSKVFSPMFSNTLKLQRKKNITSNFFGLSGITSQTKE